MEQCAVQFDSAGDMNVGPMRITTKGSFGRAAGMGDMRWIGVAQAQKSPDQTQKGDRWPPFYRGVCPHHIVFIILQKCSSRPLLPYADCIRMD